VHEDSFTIIEDVVAPGDPEHPHHIFDYETQEIVSLLWTKYLAEIRAQCPPTTVVQAMRRVSYTLDNEAFPGDKLQRGIRAVSRSRRTATFSAALWHADDGRIVHQAELVTVFIEPGQGATEIPDDFWAAVEKLEGRSIPIAERA
jgi:hypothetical protein